MIRSQASCYDVLIKAVREASHPAPPPAGWYEPTSVMALLGLQEDPNLLFIQKAEKRGYPWSNHMAFPGGHTDPEDDSRLGTALRELEEEMGISPDQVDVIGSLGHFQTINDKDIEAFIGIWDERQEIHYDASEISRVFQIPLHHLIRVHKKNNLSGRTPGFDELIYPFEDVVIWGATAKIIHHFMEILLNA